MKVCMQEVKLIYSDPGGWDFSDPTMGMCLDLIHNKVLISTAVDKSRQDKVLVHEIIHYISNSCYLGINESQTSAMAIYIYKVIKESKGKGLGKAEIHNSIFTHNNDCGIGMTEMQVAVLAYWLHQWIVDNPTIIDKVVKAEKYYRSKEVNDDNT